VRTALTGQQRHAAARIEAPDPVLRAGRVGAVTIGLVVGRYLLELDGLRDAPAAQIRELLRPCVQALVAGPPPSE
jgi:hypothetical protein